MSASSIPSRGGIVIRNLGVMMLIVVPVIYLLRQIPLPATRDFNIFSYLLSFSFLAIGGYSLNGMTKRGKVLLKAGHSPLQIIMIGLSLFMIGIGTFELIFDNSSNVDFERAFRAIAMGLGFGIGYAFGLSICERGIWRYGSVLRWEQIRAIERTPGTDGQFRFEIQNSWFPMRYGVLSVPYEHADRFEALVRAHLAEHTDAEQSS